MTDPLLGRLHEEEGIGWYGETTLVWGGRPYGIDLMLQVDEDEGTGIADAQRQAFTAFTEKWDSVEPLLVEALIRYYNQEEKYSYGPDNEEEAALWWRDIRTYEELVNAVTPETLVIPPETLMEQGRRVYLLFRKSWGGEDLDDNGIGVCFTDETITAIGYKDIAF